MRSYSSGGKEKERGKKRERNRERRREEEGKIRREKWREEQHV